MEHNSPGQKSKYVYVDPDLIDLFPDYLTNRRGELTNIENLINHGDLKEIEFIGHKLSGNAALFGLAELGEKGKLLEQAAKLKDVKQVLYLTAEMLHYVNAVQPAPEASLG